MFSWGLLSTIADTTGQNYRHFYMDASRMIPVANENRPINMAVRYLIRSR